MHNTSLHYRDTFLLLKICRAATCRCARVYILLATLVASGVVGASTAEAACENIYTSGVPTIAGYAPAWNALTDARELLVQGTECTATTTTVIVGSGASNQYVYNQAYYWTGSTWAARVLMGASPILDNAWYNGKAAATVPLSAASTTYIVGLVCQYGAGDWKCGCTDKTCAASRWQLQGVAAGSPYDQCRNAVAPLPAQTFGLTKLAFCEDFSDPNRVNLGTTLNDGQTFTQVSRGNIFTAEPMPASAFSFANGVLSVKPTRNNYQVNMISTVPTGGGAYKGFALKGSGWYAEIRWKHAACNMSTAFPAFWSMDLGHLYGSKQGFLEPDFYEYIGQRYIGALHYWQKSGVKNDSVSTQQAMPVDPTRFFVAGALAEPGATGYAWYLNDTLMARRTPTWLSFFNNFASPVMFGSGPECPYDVDYVRVWTKS